MATGNALASKVVILILVALYRGARFLLEQPWQSRAPDHPRMQALFSWYNVFVARIFHGIFGASTAKPQNLWSNDEALLMRLWLQAGKRPNTSSGEELVKRQMLPDGRIRWTGNKEKLKSSQPATYTNACFALQCGRQVVHTSLWSSAGCTAVRSAAKARVAGALECLSTLYVLWVCQAPVCVPRTPAELDSDLTDRELFQAFCV